MARDQEAQFQVYSEVDVVQPYYSTITRKLFRMHNPFMVSHEAYPYFGYNDESSSHLFEYFNGNGNLQPPQYELPKASSVLSIRPASRRCRKWRKRLSLLPSASVTVYMASHFSDPLSHLS
mmetsp:Transcript_15418/g.37978  ORF Transcript_15418/g.37978 Transcript_15418/m.37978 type:complete len:121 (-) Transcript_15418:773-1135(-)